jgi:hypothetical protein
MRYLLFFFCCYALAEEKKEESPFVNLVEKRIFLLNVRELVTLAIKKEYVVNLEEIQPYFCIKGNIKEIGVKAPF